MVSRAVSNPPEQEVEEVEISLSDMLRNMCEHTPVEPTAGRKGFERPRIRLGYGIGCLCRKADYDIIHESVGGVYC